MPPHHVVPSSRHLMNRGLQNNIKIDTGRPARLFRIYTVGIVRRPLTSSSQELLGLLLPKCPFVQHLAVGEGDLSL